MRQLLLDPYVFLEVLISAGCRLGPSNSSVQSVHNPDHPLLRAMVRLSEPLDGEMIESPLDNLRISEEVFLERLDRLNPRHRN